LNRKQESTVPLWPSTTITDSAMVAIGTIQTTNRKVPKPEEIRLLVHWGGQMDRQSQHDHRSPTTPPTDSQQCQHDHWPLNQRIADRVNMTIGTNYRSGSTIVATTQEADKEDADSAMVAIRGDNNHKSQQCHCGHRQPLPTAPWWPSGQYIANSVSVTIGDNQLDSAIVAIPSTRVDSVNMTIDRQQPAVSFPTVWVKATAAANQQPTGIPGVGDNSPERHRASRLPQREATAPNLFGWQEWREATRQASRQWCQQ
jgi:hypothetical protein